MSENTDPKQIVCTGEEGSDVWNCAFGTWSSDDFGIDSDEAVGNGERLYVRRDLYDDAIRRAEMAERREAQVYELVKQVSPVTVVSLNGYVSRCDGQTFAKGIRVTLTGKQDLAPDKADAIANLINHAHNQFYALNPATS